MVETPYTGCKMRPRLAYEYVERDIFEKVTVQDFSPSIYDMVKTGIAGIGNVNSGRYSFPNVPENDAEAHEMPDYQRITLNADIAEKEEFIEQFFQNEKNYEKPNPEPGLPAPPTPEPKQDPAP